MTAFFWAGKVSEISDISHAGLSRATYPDRLKLSFLFVRPAQTAAFFLILQNQ
jgi:hypothetical protein